MERLLTSKDTLSLVLWILIIQLISFTTSRLTDAQLLNWYSGLIKPDLTPPSIVFPIVWTLLYSMIALAGWWLWKHHNQPQAKKAFRFFMLQLIMNWLWTPIFFYWHLISIALLWILALIIVTGYVIYLSLSHYRFSAYMLIPYFLWLCFAAYLNASIWYLN